MAVRLNIDNWPAINIKATTKLNADAAAGVTSLAPENTGGFATHDFIYIGDLGGSLCEKLQLTISGGNFTVGATLHDHKRFERITGVYGDQVRIYSAPNVDGTAPADSAFTTVVATVDINPNDEATEYIHAAGDSTLWYKWVYWNSYAVAAVSYLADVDALRGGNIGTYATIAEVRDEAGFTNNKYVTDEKVSEFITRACREIDSRLYKFYATPFAAPVPQPIQNIAKRLAAGYLLVTEYGIYADGTNKDGSATIKWAIGDPNAANDTGGQIGAILRNELQLFDDTGTSLLIEQRIGGWPDDTTQTLGEFDDSGNPTAGGGTIFGISHKF